MLLHGHGRFGIRQERWNRSTELRSLLPNPFALTIARTEATKGNCLLVGYGCKCIHYDDYPVSVCPFSDSRRNPNSDACDSGVGFDVCAHTSIIERWFRCPPAVDTGVCDYRNAIRQSDARAGVRSCQVTGTDCKWVGSCQQDVVQR